MLTNIRALFHSKKDTINDIDLTSLKNFYSREFFHQRLFIEKRRTERLNSNASILIFNFQRVIDSLVKEKNSIYNKLLNFVKLISKNVRETDAVCFQKPAMIYILFPDTNTEGAKFACQRLLQKILMELSILSISETIRLEDIEVDIIAYPEKTNEKSLPQEFTLGHNLPASMTVSSPELRASSNNRTNFIFKRDYDENLNLCCYSSNGTTLAMPFVNDLYFVQKMVNDYDLKLQSWLKRLIDIGVAIIALIVSAPILLIISILIKITSPGPVLFKQKRVGYRGKPFTFLKFRSMHVNCESKTHEDYVKKLIHGQNQDINNGSKDSPYFKITRDPRITWLGHILRKTSLDELPQFWNVLKGEMSLVGPRPPIAYEVREYQSWHRRRIADVKPGITGLWQVSGRNRTTFDEMVRLDIHYTENWSLKLDFKIILKTFKAVLDGN